VGGAAPAERGLEGGRGGAEGVGDGGLIHYCSKLRIIAGLTLNCNY
jgi:hypothetical protein